MLVLRCCQMKNPLSNVSSVWMMKFLFPGRLPTRVVTPFVPVSFKNFLMLKTWHNYWIPQDSLSLTNTKLSLVHNNFNSNFDFQIAWIDTSRIKLILVRRSLAWILTARRAWMTPLRRASSDVPLVANRCGTSTWSTRIHSFATALEITLFVFSQTHGKFSCVVPSVR